MTTREVKPGALAQLRAPVVACGGSRDSVIPLAPVPYGIATGSQPLRASKRSCIVQSVIDIGAILFAAFFICLLAVAIAVAVFAFLFVKF